MDKKLNLDIAIGNLVLDETKCKYANTLNDIHSKLKTYKDYWLFTEVFCLLHDNKDYCNCNEDNTIKSDDSVDGFRLDKNHMRVIFEQSRSTSFNFEEWFRFNYPNG